MVDVFISVLLQLWYLIWFYYDPGTYFNFVMENCAIRMFLLLFAFVASICGYRIL